jgi:hypothetical protein
MLLNKAEQAVFKAEYLYLTNVEMAAKYLCSDKKIDDWAKTLGLKGTKKKGAPVRDYQDDVNRQIMLNKRK